MSDLSHMTIITANSTKACDALVSINSVLVLNVVSAAKGANATRQARFKATNTATVCSGGSRNSLVVVTGITREAQWNKAPKTEFSRITFKQALIVFIILMLRRLRREDQLKVWLGVKCCWWGS